MQVIACDIAPQPDLALSLGFEYVTLDDLLRRSHIISLHATLTAESLHMINRETLARCMRGVVFINTARGALIDTHALLEAIESGVVAGAGLDVLEEERVLRQKATRVIGEQIIERMRAGLQSEESRMQNPARIDELQMLMHNEALLSRPEVVFTPHVAFNSVEAIERINDATLQNFHAFMAGEPINVLSPA
jgi:D-lactate dehydrogenase